MTSLSVYAAGLSLFQLATSCFIIHARNHISHLSWSESCQVAKTADHAAKTYMQQALWKRKTRITLKTFSGTSCPVCIVDILDALVLETPDSRPEE